MIWFVLATLLSLALGAIVAAYARRGRRVGDHPHCASCEYNLVGAPADRTRCPECGADLAAPMAIRIGERRRRPRLIALSVMFLLLIPACLITLGWGQHNQFNWASLRPVWLLTMEMRSPATDFSASIEINRRLTAGSLSRGQIDYVIRAGLEAQANANRPWSTRWGDLIEKAHSRGLVATRDWDTYITQSMGTVTTIRVRPRIRRGADFPMKFEGESRRGSETSSYVVAAHIRKLEFAGRPALRAPWHLAHNVAMRRFDIQMPLRWSELNGNDLPDGEHEWVATVELIAHDGMSDESRVIARKTQTLRARSAITRESTVTPIRDDRMQSAIEQSLTCRGAILSTEFTSIAGKPATNPRLRVQFLCSMAPLPMAFEVWARQGERQWKLGNVNMPGKRGSGWVMGGDVTGIDDCPIDLILRSSAEVAENTLEITEFWEGEVVIKDIRVTDRRRRAATRATAPATAP